MTEAQKTPGKVEATEEVKRLAGICVAEGKTAAEIEDVSDEVRVQLGVYLRSLGGQAGSAEPQVSYARDTGKDQDVVEEDPRLKRFADQYQNLATEDKVRCPWEKARERLLKNGGRYLALAEEMNLGGILFGIDREGNPLFADDGEEPIMTDMNYRDTRKAVYLKDSQGQWGADNMSGYEMFPYAGGKDGYDKSEEILAFERFTKRPFVVSPDRKEWRSSWLESGDTPAWPRGVYFGPSDGYAGVDYGFPGSHGPERGVRRLLRVKES